MDGKIAIKTAELIFTMRPARAIVVFLLAAVLASCARPPAGQDPTPPPGMILIPGGTFLMGSGSGFAHEQPVHEVQISPFYLDVHEVTNDQFAAFIKATGYVTEAERWGWSLVYDPDAEGTERVLAAPWWVKVEGADWRHPTGPDSSIDGKENYPVVQVSWNDAAAYCAWAGKRLPTEAEWEYAARAGAAGGEYPWGDDFAPGGKPMANTWTGHFPERDTGEDGYMDLAPVGKFPPNPFGLFDMAGNVWEWCADWYDPAYYARSPRKDPKGPAGGLEKVQRGGSWMCSTNYCLGYRVSHRNKTTPDSGLNNTGFRCAMDGP